MDIKLIKDSLDLCIEALLLLHPEMDPNEPCVIFEAYESAIKARDDVNYEHEHLRG